MKTTKNLFHATLLALAVSAGAHGAPVLHSELTQAHAGDASQWSNAWLEIDVAQFERNLQTLQARLGEDTRMCVTMKADAYGHGISLLIPAVIRQSISCIGVGSNEEARIAREGGYRGRIMRLRAAPLGEMRAAMELGMEELLGNPETAAQLADAARRAGREVSFHLSLNSGEMNRNGLEVSSESGKLRALEILALKGRGLKPVGIMTHFALEDLAEIRKELAEFKADAQTLIQRGGLERSEVLLHVANSLVTMELPEAHLDMVRPGRVLYGDSSYGQFGKLMSFKSRIAAVNEYPAGSGVGYGHTYRLTRDSRLANIPVGYSDGYRRVFGNRGHVLIRGQRAPIVGGVSMNTFMVDVTDIPGVSANDEVVLYGRQGEAEVTQAELEGVIKEIMVDMYTPWSQTNPKIPVASASSGTE